MQLVLLHERPQTSESDSFIAPDWPQYSSPASASVTPVAELVADHVEQAVITPSTCPSPSPKTMRWPSQKAFGYRSPK